MWIREFFHRFYAEQAVGHWRYAGGPLYIGCGFTDFQIISIQQQIPILESMNSYVDLDHYSPTEQIVCCVCKGNIYPLLLAPPSSVSNKVDGVHHEYTASSRPPTWNNSVS